jgi:hypothetical protein
MFYRRFVSIIDGGFDRGAGSVTLRNNENLTDIDQVHVFNVVYRSQLGHRCIIPFGYTT